MAQDELELVHWFSRQRRHARLKLGIGDDMAVVAAPPGAVLFACDMLLDGVHFDSRTQPWELIGRKAVASNLSDCAAMAVRPLAVTVALALPAEMTMRHVEALYQGIHGIAAEYDVAVAGGDTTRWTHPLAIDVAVVAEPWPSRAPIPRSGAVPGDRLYVTGKLGGSLLGRHLTFAPRVAEARALTETLGDRLHALMDISDGLSLDLWRMCQASNAGAELDEGLLTEVVSDDARRLSEDDGAPALQHALSDGEDFELLAAVEGDAPGLSFPIYPIGRVIDSGLFLRRTDGSSALLAPKGYVH